MPQSWAAQAQWRVLETHFGLGLNFLATWQAWAADAQRPRLLHFVAIAPRPVGAPDLLRGLELYPELAPQAQQLCAQWHDLGPGLHRMSFEGGHVLLTLCVGELQPMLRQLSFAADAVYLHGCAQEGDGDICDQHTLKALARCCRRGTRVATGILPKDAIERLAQCGFVLHRVGAAPPNQTGLRGEFNPPWEPKTRHPCARTASCAPPGQCIVIGGGLAGAAAAASLARRGWQVSVLDGAAAPAAGASGLPAGLVVPRLCADDNLLSRLSNAGVRATWQQVRGVLREGYDYALTGVRERRLDGGGHKPDLWHANAGWLKPAQLVRSLLAQPGITWHGRTRVHELRRQGDTWQVLDAQGKLLAQATQVVVCAGFGSHDLLQRGLPLQALRGQLSWGWRCAQGTDAADFPATPVNGGGNFIPQVPTEQGLAWVLGSSFERDSSDDTVRAADHRSNFAKLQTLLPATAQALAAQFERAQVQAFAAVRCATPDRLPVVGPVDALNLAGLWVSTAMGARGLSLAVLCAELLAAQWHGEPLPVEPKLAQALSPGRRSLLPGLLGSDTNFAAA